MTVRCLVVDDSPRFLTAVHVLLERRGMTVVRVASSSAEALERIAELRPDVTLVDVHLGEERSGTGETARLRPPARPGACDGSASPALASPRGTPTATTKA